VRPFRLLLRLSCFAVLLLAACDPSSPRDACSGRDAPAGCGMACSPLAPCPMGTYCGPADLCVADCSESVRCRSGRACDDEGRCSAPMDAGPDVAPPDAPPPDFGPPRDTPVADGACASVRLETTRSTPNVVLIIDQSGSMGMEEFPAGSGVLRWNALRESLIGAPGAAGGFLDALDSSVRFGLVTYREEPAISGCPDLRVVPALIDNYGTLQGVYSTLRPGGATPTGEAIQATLARLPEIVTVPDEPTIFVLATDGEPNRCDDITDTTGGRAASLAAVEAAFDMGVRTFVISVGADVSTTHLQELANAGAGATPSDPPAMFWLATDTSTLGTALDAIIGSVASCSIELDGRIDPSMACMGTVTLDGAPLACGDPNGWRAVDATHIELTGAACDTLQSSGGVLEATFPCEVIVF